MTTPQENIDLVRAAYAKLHSDDWDGFYSYFDESAELHEAASLPYGGVYTGLDEIRRALSFIKAAWSDIHLKILEMTAGGDLVFVYFQLVISGKKTGKSASIPVAELWRFRDGKVVELRPIYWDTHKVREIFGDC